MQPSIRLIAALLVLCLAPAAHSYADDDKTKTDAKPAEKPTEATTQGSVEVGGQHIAYSAIAGTITVGATDSQDAQLGIDGKPTPGTQLAAEEPKEPKDAPPTARMSYFAYLKKDARPEERPITFFYNGGPGSSTVWLHMGSLGPRHVVTETDRHLPAAPYKLADNPESLLDVSDLVFIDMPGTGFGRLLGKDPERAFWGIDEDANAFARFIQRFITRYSRWNSRSSGIGLPANASSFSRITRAQRTSSPPTTITVRDATVGPLSGTTAVSAALTSMQS